MLLSICPIALVVEPAACTSCAKLQRITLNSDFIAQSCHPPSTTLRWALGAWLSKDFNQSMSRSGLSHWRSWIHSKCSIVRAKESRSVGGHKCDDCTRDRTNRLWMSKLTHAMPAQPPCQNIECALNKHQMNDSTVWFYIPILVLSTSTSLVIPRFALLG